MPGSAAPMVGHAGGADEALFTGLLLAGSLLAWFAFTRLRGTGFERIARPWGWAALGMSALVLVLAFVLPPRLLPTPAAERPRGVARLQILSPQPEQVFRGDPAQVEVRISLEGARLVAFTSRDLSPTEGHLHVSLDRSLVSMTEGLSQRLSVPPGQHTIEVTFVAADHGPFRPPIRASVTFSVVE
jgi:hypothetical protein